MHTNDNNNNLIYKGRSFRGAAQYCWNLLPCIFHRYQEATPTHIGRVIYCASLNRAKPGMYLAVLFYCPCKKIVFFCTWV